MRTRCRVNGTARDDEIEIVLNIACRANVPARQGQLLTDANGSTISFEDYAIAMVDEIERPAHRRSASLSDIDGVFRAAS